MRLTRIHVDAPLQSDSLLQLPDGPAQHLTRVLRLPVGAALRVFNGQGGEFDACIEAIGKHAVQVRVQTHHPLERESPLQITLLQGIARGEKMDLILQKATELGIQAVVPVASMRSTVRLDDKTALRKQQHWQAVVVSACEQCGRNRVPVIAAPSSLAAAAAATHAQIKLLLEPAPTAGTLRTLLTTAHAESATLSVCLMVGPEGGLDPKEVETAIRSGFQPCQLGPRVLRTETAAMAALAALQTLVGDLT